MTDHILIAGQRHPLTRGAYIIGRAPESDILLPEGDGTASRSHARLERDSEGFWTVVDLGSSNGTFVGERAVRGLVRLCHGDAIRVGRTVIRLDAPRLETPRVDEPSPEPAAWVQPRRAEGTSPHLPAYDPSYDAGTSFAVPAHDPVPASPEELPAFLRPATLEREEEASIRMDDASSRDELDRSGFLNVPSERLLHDAPGAERAWSPVGLVPGGFMLAAWALPWVTARLFGYGGTVSYLEVLGQFGTVLRLMQEDARFAALLVPLATTILSGFGGVRSMGGACLTLAGAIGVLASAALLHAASSGVFGMSLTSFLGGGFFLYAFASLGALGLGVVRLVARR